MTLRATIPLALPLVTGCFGDVTRSSGEFGRLTYALATDYASEEDELTDLVLLTGYPHWISVRLTEDGRKAAGDEAGTIVHRADGAHVDTPNRNPEGGDPPSFTLQSDVPGEVEVRSELDRRVFDQITLRFGDPTALELSTWIRPPWAEDWEDASGVQPLVVEQGTQIGLLAIPVADGVRLAGTFHPTIAADPPEPVVPDAQVWVVQEGGVTEFGSQDMLYAILPGTVTLTVSDPVHGVSVTRTVEIVALGEG